MKRLRILCVLAVLSAALTLACESKEQTTPTPELTPTRGIPDVEIQTPTPLPTLDPWGTPIPEEKFLASTNRCWFELRMQGETRVEAAEPKIVCTAQDSDASGHLHESPEGGEPEVGEQGFLWYDENHLLATWEHKGKRYCEIAEIPEGFQAVNAKARTGCELYTYDVRNKMLDSRVPSGNEIFVIAASDEWLYVTDCEYDTYAYLKIGDSDGKTVIHATRKVTLEDALIYDK